MKINIPLSMLEHALNSKEYLSQFERANQVLALATNDRYSIKNIEYCADLCAWIIDDESVVCVPAFPFDNEEMAMMRVVNFILENKDRLLAGVVDAEADYWAQDARDYAVSLRF